MYRYTNLLWAIFFLCVLPACESMRAIIVDFEVDATVQVVQQPESGARPSPVPMHRAAIDKRRLSPYADLLYESELLSIVLVLNTRMNEAVFTNKAPFPVTMRFDQATLTSNFQPNEIALQERDLFPENGKRVPGIALWMYPPALTMQPNGKTGLFMFPNCQELFPSGGLFNVQLREKKTPELIETGIGNTLRMTLPVEYEGKRELMIFEFKARNAKARTSYA